MSGSGVQEEETLATFCVPPDNAAFSVSKIGDPGEWRHIFVYDRTLSSITQDSVADHLNAKEMERQSAGCILPRFGIC